MTRNVQLVAAIACMKSLLMVFNFTFWISGIFIFGVGIWIEVQWKYLEISPEMTDLFQNVAYVLIGTGAFIILIGSFACCCTIKGQPMLLYIYGGILAVVLVLEFGAGISLFQYRSNFAEGFDQAFNDSLISYSKGKVDIISKVDFMQSSMHCCGSRDYTDWFSMDAPTSVPRSCCIDENDCDVTNPQQIYQQGCYELMLEFFESNIGMVAGTASGIALFTFCGLLLACCLGRTIKKTKYEEMA